jgi:hypothetical protein
MSTSHLTEYAASLYNTSAAACAAAIYDFYTALGSNSAAEALGYMAETEARAQVLAANLENAGDDTLALRAALDSEEEEWFGRWDDWDLERGWESARASLEAETQEEAA